VEVGKTEEDLNITVAGWFWQLCDRAGPVLLHLNTFQHDNELDKADPLHLTFAL
jgi:hypothetical protein